MRLHAIAILILSFTLSLFATNDGLTTDVSWDSYSLAINGERVFIFSGEFHYERLPVPELWLDVFQKYKANGLNAISIYTFWSYHSASRGVFDFETSGKNVQLLLDTAKEAGLYVIARPGPYCNAETNAGGFALWTSDGSGGKYRTADETYHQAWLPWMNEINAVLARNQITKGGPVILYQIENELQETTHDANNTLVLYMEQIENATRAAGITVPFTSNEKGQRSESWSTDYEDVGGAVNVYGLDSYPGGLSCTNPDSGFSLVRNYYQWFQNYSYTQPEFFPEFEAGYFQPWGGYFYDSCAAEHDPAFADVYYKNNIGQRTTMMSLYMAFGGTNWGNLAAPVVYTSYDYSAPLRETREVQDKFKQTKLIGLFTRVSRDLLYTEMESNGTGNAVDSASIWTWVLRNPVTTARFYTVQHSTSSSRNLTTFSIDLETSAGAVTVPNVQLNGRQSKILVTDYHLSGSTLLYASADILTYGVFRHQTVLVLYLEAGQIGEFAFKAFQSDSPPRTYGNTKVAPNRGNGTYTKYTYSQAPGETFVQISDNILVLLLDIPSAWAFHAPANTPDPNVQPDKQIFVLGPYLVRTASTSQYVVSVTGDNVNDTSIEVFVDRDDVDTISWNGVPLKTSRTKYGSLRADLAGAQNRAIVLPELTTWSVADSLPEASRGYDDSTWTVCDKNTTLSPVKPLTLPVLFSSDYGYYVGAKIYRGYFDGKAATSANVTAQNGLASGWNAWLNGKLVGGSPGNATLSATPATLDFSNATLFDTDNVLTVVCDYTGHDETSTGPAGAENPRGLLGAVLHTSNTSTSAPYTNGTNSTTTAPTFTRWKIQGNAGGAANIDPVRGPLNEGGLHGERLGWHLPGFRPQGAGWSTGLSSPQQGLPTSGIAWYRTTFTLALDADLDVPIGLELSAPNGTVARVQVFVNGYTYGKFVPHIGPQTRFPIPPGVLNNRGENTLALSLWAQTDEGARLDTVRLFAYGVYESGFGFSRDWSYLQPGWTEERLQYA